MSLIEAWRKYLADVDEIHRTIPAEPIIKECPATEAAAVRSASPLAQYAQGVFGLAGGRNR